MLFLYLMVVVLVGHVLKVKDLVGHVLEVEGLVGHAVKVLKFIKKVHDQTEKV